MKLGRIFHYFWQVIRRYKIAFFSLFFLSSGRILFSVIIGGYIYKLIIDTLGDFLISAEDKYEIVLTLIFSMVICFVLGTFVSRWSEYIFFRFLSRTLKEIYDFTFAKLAQHSYTFFSNSFTGTLVNRAKRYVQSFDTILDLSLNSFWQIVSALVFAIISLSFQSKVLALYFLIWCLIYGVIMIAFVKRKFKVDLKWAEADSKTTGFLSDSITNVLNLKTFSAFPREWQLFKELSTNLKNRGWDSFRLHTIRATVQSVLMVIFHVFVLYLMLSLWRKGEITMGVFVMTYAYMVNIFERMWDFASSLNRFMKAVSDAKEMVDILDKTPEIMDPENPEELRKGEGKISFENVSFEYVEDLAVFENFSLVINAGEKAGLVGHSGSGKSTITKILLRFADVKDGSIKIDGQDIRHITQDDLRSKISYVPQDPILFHRTIKENIGYSKSGATDEEITDAAKKAHAHEFISKLPKGYDTLVGERGVKLSGGERQRVAIARAMLKDAPILVLDEATSSLDSVSETYIQDAFSELMKGKTTIVIAHRLSTIQKMDRIVVLDKGKIVEEGTHKELLAKGGTYAELWNHQTGGFLE